MILCNKPGASETSVPGTFIKNDNKNRLTNQMKGEKIYWNKLCTKFHIALLQSLVSYAYDSLNVDYILQNMILHLTKSKCL